jgi:hypothetical protein
MSGVQPTVSSTLSYGRRLRSTAGSVEAVIGTAGLEVSDG